jgi:hypothetical protein
VAVVREVAHKIDLLGTSAYVMRLHIFTRKWKLLQVESSKEIFSLHRWGTSSNDLTVIVSMFITNAFVPRLTWFRIYVVCPQAQYINLLKPSGNFTYHQV